ncbi:hypothetical protein DFA_08920 [Cavenderia fasciculata]|uniref:Uncharacterized protein n=1 Tax=Cavenderia fasciculata TaxID=261658 RepID=F4Q526_CACFS|nr:uncharacterized protein DFA_08920 [Cavenderia fasciculata]EGG17919.1 hypothetical protein DFA_08920 [Cavenderia fasciculata]|eukprot:XP_004356403.1 hypothetical protein DFA_08920 [Cavenderia fasciculata]
MEKPKSIVAYFSIDKKNQSNANDHDSSVNPRWSDHTKDKLIETITKQEQIDKEATATRSSNSTPAQIRARDKKKEDQLYEALKQFHTGYGFEDKGRALTYSHTIQTLSGLSRSRSRRNRNGSSSSLLTSYEAEEYLHRPEPQFYLTVNESFICPIFQGICTEASIINQVVVRHYGYDATRRTFGFHEYELSFAKVTDISHSAGKGDYSKVINLVLSPAIITTTIAEFNVDTGNYSVFSTGTVDFKFTDRCKRVVLPFNPSNNYPPQILDDTIEESKQLLKDKQVEYQVDPDSQLPATTRIMVVNDQIKGHNICRRLNVDSEMTIDNLVTKIATFLSKEKSSIHYLINKTNNHSYDCRGDQTESGGNQEKIKLFTDIIIEPLYSSDFLTAK